VLGYIPKSTFTSDNSRTAFSYKTSVPITNGLRQRLRADS
jgi:hypothetical protein